MEIFSTKFWHICIFVLHLFKYSLFRLFFNFTNTCIMHDFIDFVLDFINLYRILNGNQRFMLLITMMDDIFITDTCQD